MNQSGDGTVEINGYVLPAGNYNPMALAREFDAVVGQYKKSTGKDLDLLTVVRLLLVGCERAAAAGGCSFEHHLLMLADANAFSQHVVTDEYLSRVGAAAAAAAFGARLRGPDGRFIVDPNAPKVDNAWTDAMRRRTACDSGGLSSPLTPAERQEVIERGYRGPQRINPWTGQIETMELSHEPVPRRDSSTNVVPRWPDDHAAVDPNRKLGRSPYSPFPPGPGRRQ